MKQIPSKELSVIIPVYNEKNTLKQLVKRVLKQKEVFEVIIVDDGSKDGSRESIKSLIGKNIKLIKHPTNLGKGAAMISGLKIARGKWVIFQDADFECDPADYSRLLKPILDKQYDFVIGNRWKNYNGYMFNKLGNWLITAWVNILFGTSISDACCGYKVGPKVIWDSLKLESNKFEIDVEIVAKLALNKINFTEVDIAYHPRTYEEGKKVRAKDALKDFIKLTYLKLGSVFSN